MYTVGVGIAYRACSSMGTGLQRGLPLLPRPLKKARAISIQHLSVRSVSGSGPALVPRVDPANKLDEIGRTVPIARGHLSRGSLLRSDTTSSMEVDRNSFHLRSGRFHQKRLAAACRFHGEEGRNDVTLGPRRYHAAVVLP